MREVKKCWLVDEFEKNKRRYLQFRHQFSKKSNYERELRVLKFLRFCCRFGIRKIKDIDKKAFDEFMRSIQDKSLETQRKYRLAISEFVERAGLDFVVKRDVNRQKLKKYNKLKSLLKDCVQDECIEKLKDEIMKLF